MGTGTESEAVLARVWRAVSGEPRRALEWELAPTDLQTVLLSVARRRAAAVTPARLVRRWREDRFVRPSDADPRVLAGLELRLWHLLPGSFAGVELSPVVPLGTCSAVASVDQNRVVATVRGTEVVSDPTNALAVEAAVRRRRQDAGGRVDLAACQRVLRGQAFDGPGLSAHFRLFALVSSAPDTGSGRTEARLLADHLAFWSRALSDLLPHAGVRLAFTGFGSTVLVERFRDTVLPALGQPPANVAVVEDPSRVQGAAYYMGGALSITAGDGTRMVDLGDGGFTTWTAQLTANAKERCLISCIATERLAALAGDTPASTSE